MRRSTLRTAALVVALTVLLSGCSATDGSSGGTETPTPGVTTDGTTATPPATRTPTGPTATPTPTLTPTGTPGAAFSPSGHAAALRSAGSYTLRFSVTRVRVTGEGSRTIRGVQRVDLATGEESASVTVVAERNRTVDYYRPPGSTTLFVNASGSVGEIPVNRSPLPLNYTRPGAAERAFGFPTNVTREGAVETEFGVADRYVLDDPERLSRTLREQYASGRSDVSFDGVDITLVVDRDTGAVVNYTSRVTITAGGETVRVESTFELTDLGSTTVDRPDWVAGANGSDGG